MSVQLNRRDISVILESLKFTKQHRENYQHYPSYEFKRTQVSEVEEVIAKVRVLAADIDENQTKEN